jgi:hypothetical protein
MLKYKGWIVAVLLALVAAGLFGWWKVGYRVSRSGVYWIPPPNRTTVEDDSLRLTMNSVERDGDGVLLTLTLQDLENVPKYRLGADFGTPVAVQWWDGDGESVGEESFVVVSEEFDRRARESLTVRIVFEPPIGAASVSVRCGRLMTHKVLLPLDGGR